MVAKRKGHQKEHQGGQALFELIMFLPFLVFLLQLIMTLGNSINGGINQQKVLRGFYYHKMRNSSSIVSSEDFANLPSMSQVGFLAFSWAEKQQAGTESTLAPCYEVKKLFGQTTTESCESPANGDTTSFIRIFSFYGICGPHYVVNIPDITPVVGAQNFVENCRTL